MNERHYHLTWALSLLTVVVITFLIAAACPEFLR